MVSFVLNRMQGLDFILFSVDVPREQKGMKLAHGIERFIAPFGAQFRETCETFKTEIARVLSTHIAGLETDTQSSVQKVHLRAVEYLDLEILGVEVLFYDQNGQPLKRVDESLSHPCLNLIPGGHEKTTRLFGRPITTLAEISACASFPMAVSYGGHMPAFPQSFGWIDHDQPIVFSPASGAEFWVVVSCLTDSHGQEVTARLTPVPEECPVRATVYWHRFLERSVKST